jgi:hypothetical protein
MGGGNGGPPMMGGGPIPDGTGIGFDGGVVMFYQLHDLHMNCERMFNLCCLYGNVMRVCLFDICVSIVFSLLHTDKIPTLERRLCNGTNG